MIVDAIRNGMWIETAAAFAGISKQTFYNWLKEGRRQKSGQKRDFLDAIERALAECEYQDLKKITQAADEGIWQAAKFRLERRFPQRWGDPNKSNIEVIYSGPEVKENDSSSSEKEKEAEQLENNSLDPYVAVFAELIGSAEIRDGEDAGGDTEDDN